MAGRNDWLRGQVEDCAQDKQQPQLHISNDPPESNRQGTIRFANKSKASRDERTRPLHSLRCCASTPDLMEAAAATTSSLVLFSSPRRSLTSLNTSSSLLRPSCSSCSVPSAKQQHPVCLDVPRLHSSKKKSILRCSSSLADGPSTVGSSVRWVLDPAGDGDWRHIGYKVARPGAFEIASDAVTVGRVADKADIVLPIATVSGTHARLEKKDGRLLVTDLGSTNGTYINERRLNPGFAIPIDPGSLLIFGDIHLAMFRVRKMIVEVPSETDKTQQETKTEVVSAAVEDTTS
ncbi:uncharacterized protein LOC120696587 [Panicum virgatum]|uniref:FHA domain-containing protein n=1 Tax=Panicum virgatum TaxID=38727 RepID=A0A8T0UKX6_PANVG|nr:uncharacterized protein LOC120696587 [Panicum virgatum]KAG2622778.1 hypothetical protein PVAP13_3KG001400 [Panicum virgatum]